MSDELPDELPKLIEPDRVDGLEWMVLWLGTTAKQNEARALRAEADVLEAEWSGIGARANAKIIELREKLGLDDSYQPEVRNEKLFFVKQ